jgi:hypothetical protein
MGYSDDAFHRIWHGAEEALPLERLGGESLGRWGWRWWCGPHWDESRRGVQIGHDVFGSACIVTLLPAFNAASFESLNKDGAL